MTLQEKIYCRAAAAGVCSQYAMLLRRAASRRALVDIFLLLGSADFCMAAGILDREILTEFKNEPSLRRHNIFIDEHVALRNPRRLFLLGMSHASLIYDDGAAQRHEVFVDRDASADITADNWAVVIVRNAGGAVERHAANHAIII